MVTRRGKSYLSAGSGIRNNGLRHQEDIINIYLLRGPMMGKKLSLFPTASVPVWCPAFFMYLAEGKILVFQGERGKKKEKKNP